MSRVEFVRTMAGPVKKREIQQNFGKTNDDESGNSSGNEENENIISKEQVINKNFYVKIAMTLLKGILTSILSMGHICLDLLFQSTFFLQFFAF